MGYKANRDTMRKDVKKKKQKDSRKTDSSANGSALFWRPVLAPPRHGITVLAAVK